MSRLAGLLGLLALLSSLGAGAAVREAPIGGVHLELGQDALGESTFLGAIDGSPSALLLNLPAGSVLRVDEAFVVRNPSAETVVLTMRIESAAEGVDVRATIDGAPASSVVLAPREAVALGLVAESTGGEAMHATASLIIDASSRGTE